MGGSISGRRTKICGISVSGNLPPANKLLSFLLSEFFNCRFAQFLLDGIRGHEHDACCKPAPGGQFHVQVLFGNPGQKRVWQCCQDTGAITRVGLTAARTTVIHAAQHLIGIDNYLVTALALDVGNKTNTAAIMLIGRVI